MGKRIIQQRRGSGTKRYTSPSHRYAGKIKYNLIDTNKEGKLSGKVVELINSRGHSAPLMKIKYNNGETCLHVAPEGIYEGMIINSGNEAKIKTGNILPLKNIPEGIQVFCLEKNPGDGGKLLRSSGTFARITNKTDDNITLKLPSKKSISLHPSCRATIGVVAGGGREDKPFVKAGKRYHAMKARNKLYPRTSPVAMSSYDHPFGSGRGRHKGRPSVPKWGAAPGANVGQIKAKRTGKKKK